MKTDRVVTITMILAGAAANVLTLQSFASLRSNAIVLVTIVALCAVESVLVGSSLFYIGNTVIIAVALSVTCVMRRQIVNGVKLIINQLFYKSEIAYGYIYDKYEITIPPRAYVSALNITWVMAAIAFVVLLSLAFAKKWRFLIVILTSCWAITEAYLGVAPAGLWNVALFLTMALMIFAIGQMKNEAGISRSGIQTAVLILVTAIAGTSLTVAVTPENGSPLDIKLGERSQAIRDKFDSTVEYFDGQAPDNENDRESSTADQQNENQQSSTGKQGSMLEEETNSLNWLEIIKNTIIILFAGLFFVVIPTIISNRRKIIRKREEAFFSDDYGESIDAAFTYAGRWVSLCGMKHDNQPVMSYVDIITTMLDETAGKEFERLAEIWLSHEFGNVQCTRADRDEMIGLVRAFGDRLWTEAGRFKRLKLKYINCMR